MIKMRDLIVTKGQSGGDVDVTVGVDAAICDIIVLHQLGQPVHPFQHGISDDATSTVTNTCDECNTTKIEAKIGCETDQ